MNMVASYIARTQEISWIFVIAVANLWTVSLVDVILNQHVISADVSMGIYCFCTEIVLEGDDQCIFRLYSQLVRVLETSGYLSHSDSLASTEESTTFDVDIRARHAGSGRSAEAIDDAVTLLLADKSFMSRRSSVRVLKLFCLIMERPQPRRSYMQSSLIWEDVLCLSLL